MTKIMTPSKTTTVGQIDKAVANYRALLEKHSRDFNTEVVQLVLGQPELADEQFVVFRRRVEGNASLIVRRVKVDRSLTPQEALDATGRVQYTDRTIVDSMPKGDLSGQEGDEVELVFFKLGRFVSDADLEKEFELRGLTPADPYSLAAVNEADPAFADKKPHGTHWKDAKGNWCYAAFIRWDDERKVYVNRNDDDWHDSWWFAGVRLPAGKAGK